MSSPFNATLLDALRRYDAQKRLLVKVELTVPSTLTLKMADDSLTTTGPEYWEPLLGDHGPIVAEGSYLTADVSPATFSFSIRDRKAAAQAAGLTALDLLASYRWHGAKVTAYLWEGGVAGVAPQQVFGGVVVSYALGTYEVTFQCMQATDWNKRMPLVEVTRARWPRAPEETVGMGVPERWGKWRDVEARATGAARWDASFQHGMMSAAGARRGARGIVVNAGRGDGAEKGLVLFASHALKTFNDEANGCTPLLEVGGHLCDLDPIGGDVVNAADGTGFKITDIVAGTDPFVVWYPLPPIDVVKQASNNADAVRSALDPLNETSFVLMDYDAGFRTAEYRFPQVGAPGTVRAYYLVAGWSGGSANAQALLTNTSSGLSDTINLTATSFPVAASVLSTHVPGTDWNIANYKVVLQFNGVSTGQVCKVHYVGIAVQFRPEWPVVVPAITRVYYAPRKHKNWHPTDGGSPNLARREGIEVPAKEHVDSTFYGTLDGFADDGGGSITGVASALIERPPDVLNHLLQRLGIGTGSIETGVGIPGSLVDARAAFLTWLGNPMESSLGVGPDFEQASDVIQRLCSDVLGWAYISRFDSKWHMVPWKPGRAVDYDRTIMKDDLSTLPTCSFSADDVVNDIELGFMLDEYTNRCIMTTALGDGRSIAGYRYRNLRDEQITVVTSAQDRLNWLRGATTNVITCTAGDYTPGGLADHVTSKMNTADAARFHQCCYGPRIVANVSDRLDINDGAAKLISFTPGDYGTFDALCAHIQTQLNASSSNWSCTYSKATKLVTIARSAGTAQLKFNSGGATSRCVAPALGFDWSADLTGSASYTGVVQVAEEFFVLAKREGSGIDNPPFQVLLETGADGANAGTPRNIAALLGFDSSRDLLGATIYSAHSPKNNREQTIATSILRYGPKRQFHRDLTTVSDTDTAREVRNRILALLAEPLLRVSFETERMPDIERGQVFQTDGSLDTEVPFPRPGSDGSWASKKFMVYRVTQNTGPTFTTIVEAVENL